SRSRGPALAGRVDGLISVGPGAHREAPSDGVPPTGIATIHLQPDRPRRWPRLLTARAVSTSGDPQPQLSEVEPMPRRRALLSAAEHRNGAAPPRQLTEVGDEVLRPGVADPPYRASAFEREITLVNANPPWMADKQYALSSDASAVTHTSTMPTERTHEPRAVAATTRGRSSLPFADGMPSVPAPGSLTGLSPVGSEHGTADPIADTAERPIADPAERLGEPPSGPAARRASLAESRRLGLGRPIPQHRRTRAAVHTQADITDDASVPSPQLIAPMLPSHPAADEPGQVATPDIGAVPLGLVRLSNAGEHSDDHDGPYTPTEAPTNTPGHAPTMRMDQPPASVTPKDSPTDDAHSRPVPVGMASRVPMARDLAADTAEPRGPTKSDWVGISLHPARHLREISARAERDGARHDPDDAVGGLTPTPTHGLPAREHIPADVEGFFRAVHDVDVSDTRVQRGPLADQAARQAEARAFTRGGVVFLPDAAGPLGHSSTQRLLVHELTHAVQQRSSRTQLRDESSIEGMAQERVARQNSWTFEHPYAAGTPLTHAPISRAGGASSSEGQPVVQRQTNDEPDDFGVPALSDYAAQITSRLASTDELRRRGSLDPHPAHVDLAGSPTGAITPTPLLRGVADHGPGLEELVDNKDRLLELCDRRDVDLDDPTTLDELAGTLFSRIRTLLRGELIVHRERSGSLVDEG
ncbi:MAG: hypothetical protein JWO57_3617, partial [Pseudonocardiales bacterium]|nr:hypothetical protein [Pseudonocardiales bacterium]